MEAWRCQATDALKFSEPLKTSNLAQYWREFRNGNFTPFRFIRLLARGLVMEIANRTGLLKPLALHGSGGSPPPRKPLTRRLVDVMTVDLSGSLAVRSRRS